MKIFRHLTLASLVLILSAAVGFFVFAPGIVERQRNAVRAHEPYVVSAQAQALHDSLIIGDWHADSLLWNRDLTKRSERGHTDIPRLLEGNVAVQVYTAVTKSPAGMNYDSNEASTRDNITLLAIGQLWPLRTWQSILQRALYQAEKLHDVAAREPDKVTIIKTATDLEEVLTRKQRGEDVVGILLGIEGAHPLEADFANLQVLTDAGYRLIALQHFFDNALGGSLHGIGNKGLTSFGRQVVEAVASQPLILDLAHSSEHVVRDVIEMTSIPLVISHTGIRSHCDVKRNIPDELMLKIAQSGGVVGIGFWGDVTCDDSPAGIASAIKHAIELLGEDHVSLGSDYDGSVPVAFVSSELAVLTQALMDEGLSEREIRKVMGENMLRVLRSRLGFTQK